MKELLIELPKNSLPKYRRLADALRTAVRIGRLRPGEVLPSTRELARRFKFHRHTVMTALAELEAEGWVEAREKVHYQVKSTLPETYLRPARGSKVAARPVQKQSWDFARPLKIGDYTPLPAYRHSFPSGFPDPRMFPLREFKSHLYDVLRSRKVLLYGDPQGELGLRHEIETYLRRIRNVSDREVVVTNGSQEAIFFLAQLLVKEGEYVAVEELGYPPAFEALRFAGARLLPVRVDAEGLVVGDLERLLKTKKIRMLYLTPLHQYPTTVTLSATRRLQLYELACKHGMAILEDDYDHEFHFHSQPVAPLASFDPAGIVYYVSTFSKLLFPSARLGFMAVPERLAREASKLKRISSRQNEPLMQETIARWMKSGGLERHLRRMRRAYAERLDSMLKELEEWKKTHPCISWTVPDGGMALWLDVGMNADKAAALAGKGSVFVYPESHYRIDGKTGSHIRLGFSGQTSQENKAGLSALFAAIKLPGR